MSRFTQFKTKAEQMAEKKVEKLNKFLEENQECKEFADVFKNFLYKQNKHGLSISVGKKMANGFSIYLSLRVKEFNVMLDYFKDDPQISLTSYKDSDIDFKTMFNLRYVRDLLIEKEETDKYCFYHIIFGYLDRDYKLDISIDR